MLGVAALAIVVSAGLALRAWLLPSRASIESIAVLPFQNLTGNPDSSTSAPASPSP